VDELASASHVRSSFPGASIGTLTTTLHCPFQPQAEESAELEDRFSEYAEFIERAHRCCISQRTRCDTMVVRLEFRPKSVGHQKTVQHRTRIRCPSVTRNGERASVLQSFELSADNPSKEIWQLVAP